MKPLISAMSAELAKKAWSHIQEVEELGGMAKAIEAGIPKLRIEEAAAKAQARIDSKTQSVIGVNKYRPTDEKPIDVLKVDNSAVRTLQQRPRISYLNNEYTLDVTDAANYRVRMPSRSTAFEVRGLTPAVPPLFRLSDFDRR